MYCFNGSINSIKIAIESIRCKFQMAMPNIQG